MKHYRRNIDRGQCGQLGLDGSVTIVAGDIAVAMAIRVDYHFHEIGILERCGSAIECSLIEHPGGRPKSPAEPTQFTTVRGKASTASFGVKVILIPEATFLFRVGRLCRVGYVLDLVSAAAH
jgi:hypothetical protein